MLKELYNKFSKHYPEFLFGYKSTDLWISISVFDKRTHKAKLDKLSLDSSEKEIKLAWYTLLKELAPNEVSQTK